VKQSSTEAPAQSNRKAEDDLMVNLDRAIAQAVASFLGQGWGFTTRVLHVGFTVDEATLGQMSLRTFQVSPVYHNLAGALFSPINLFGIIYTIKNKLFP
jgi:hypothetical protein